MNVSVLERMLKESHYDKKETDFLVKGFTEGFNIEYQGIENRQDVSRNIPFTVGDKFELWMKIMKEVKAGRFAGPFDQIPFKEYAQAPIGLVPKAGGKTRLIFHLSYDFKVSGNKSINACTPKDLCLVKYNDIDSAIQNCFELCADGKEPIYFAKTDIQSAFRILPLSIECIKWLVMKAENPATGKTVFHREMLAFWVEHKLFAFSKVLKCIEAHLPAQDS